MDTQEAARFDYVKLLILAEHDLFQSVYLPVINSMRSQLDPVGMLNKTSDLTVLPAGEDGKQRYIFEVWGPAADQVAQVLPADFWRFLRRLDYKENVGDISPDDMVAAARYLNHRERKHNTSLFNSKPRQKRGGNRDVGGVGIYFGSRKSGQHGVLYKRGNELATAEFRLQDKMALELGSAIAEAVSTNAHLTAYDEAWLSMNKRAYHFWGNRLGGSLSMAVYNAAKQGRQLDLVAQQLGLFDETEAEREYYQSLSTEEQADLARETFMPTAKGWYDGVREPELPDSAPLDTDNDDGLPF